MITHLDFVHSDNVLLRMFLDKDKPKQVKPRISYNPNCGWVAQHENSTRVYYSDTLPELHTFIVGLHSGQADNSGNGTLAWHPMGMPTTQEAVCTTTIWAR